VHAPNTYFVTLVSIIQLSHVVPRRCIYSDPGTNCGTGAGTGCGRRFVPNSHAAENLKRFVPVSRFAFPEFATGFLKTPRLRQ
jgi:hypothetical protein